VDLYKQKIFVLESKQGAEAHQRAHQVAQFLMQCLFTMFAENVKLIPKGSFVGLLESLKETPADFVPMVESLYKPQVPFNPNQYFWHSCPSPQPATSPTNDQR